MASRARTATSLALITVILGFAKMRSTRIVTSLMTVTAAFFVAASVLEDTCGDCAGSDEALPLLKVVPLFNCHRSQYFHYHSVWTLVLYSHEPS